MFSKFAVTRWPSRAVLSIGLFVFVGATAARADVVLFQDIGGTGAETVPAYYPIQGCNSTDCVALGEPYQSTVTTNTIPDTIYIGDPLGNVSDKIVASETLHAGPTTIVDFTLFFGLDLASPETCASVGGCNITYDGAVQTLGTITWGPGFFEVPPIATTTLEYQYVATPEPATLLVVAALFLMMLTVVARRNRTSRADCFPGMRRDDGPGRSGRI
jgi:hypothetical protein